MLALTQAISIRVHEGRLDDADALTDEAMRIAEQRRHEPTLAWAYAMARWRAFRHGDWAEAIRRSQATLEIAERLGFTTRIGSGKMFLGRSLVASGEVDEARRSARATSCWSADGSYTGSTGSPPRPRTC